MVGALAGFQLPDGDDLALRRCLTHGGRHGLGRDAANGQHHVGFLADGDFCGLGGTFGQIERRSVRADEMSVGQQGEQVRGGNVVGRIGAQGAGEVGHGVIVLAVVMRWRAICSSERLKDLRRFSRPSSASARLRSALKYIAVLVMPPIKTASETATAAATPTR